MVLYIDILNCKMARPKSITIQWSRPVLWEEMTRSPRIESGPGVYPITRTFSGNITLLYIGETKRQNFQIRMDEHIRDHKNGYEDFLFRYRGKKYIRFGAIEGLDCYDELTKKRILRNVETHLIWTLNPIANIKQRNTSTIWKQLYISHRGWAWAYSRTPQLNTDYII